MSVTTFQSCEYIKLLRFNVIKLNDRRNEMPVYTTEIIANIPIGGVAPYIQGVISIVNNSSQAVNVYLSAQSIVTPPTLFAQNLLSLNPNDVFTQTCPVAAYTYFQFSFYCSAPLGGLDVTLFNSSNVATPAPLASVPFKRITSEFREITTTPSVDVPALSFQRKSTPPIAASGAATITPEGIDILATDVFSYKIVLGGTVDGTFVDYPTPTTAIPTGQTDLQVNYTCTTISGGQVIFQGLGTGLSGAYVCTTVNFLNNSLFANLMGQTVTLVVNSLDQADNIAATFRMLEEW
jgi:hypothetical protein